MNNIAIGAIRVSAEKQGLQGDSPDFQKQAIVSFAKEQGLEIVEWFEYWESAGYINSQPAMKTLDYCKKNSIKFAIFLNMSRFTRAGAEAYIPLLNALEKAGTQPLDTLKTINPEKVNTLSYLGVEYDWSKFRPTFKQEILAAEDAKEDRRNILTRLIGAETAYARLGYWIGGTNYGYTTEKRQSPHGKRSYLKPVPEEAKYIKMMYELLDKKEMTKEAIVNHINTLGYRSRTKNKHPNGTQLRDTLVGHTGGVKLTEKQLDSYVRNPVYCGIRQIKRAGKIEKPVKFFGEAIIDIELFNRVNKGKISVVETDMKEYFVIRGRVPSHLLFKNIYNEMYPFKEFVLCPMCNKTFTASAPKGRTKRYPSYHCSRKHPLYRRSLDDFHKTIEAFVKRVKLTPETIVRLKASYILQLEKKRTTAFDSAQTIQNRIDDLEAEQDALIKQIGVLQNVTVIRKFEEKVGLMEIELTQLQEARNKQEKSKTKAQDAINAAWYYFDHLEELVMNKKNPIMGARLFGSMFVTQPTYQNLLDGTANLACVFELNEENVDDVSRQGEFWNQFFDFATSIHLIFKEYNMNYAYAQA